MILGIDIGGTKIEIQLFDQSYKCIARIRHATPTDFENMLDLMESSVNSMEEYHECSAIGIGLPGIIDPKTNHLHAANLCAVGEQFQKRIADRLQRPVFFLKDCHAASLAEASFGSGKGHENVVCLTIGTGISAGQIVGGEILATLSGSSGEFGHLPLPAYLTKRFNLPLLECSCGRVACYETFVCGPGLSRLAKYFFSRKVEPEQVMLGTEFIDIRKIFVELLSELVASIVHTIDPHVIVLAGSLGMSDGLTEEIERLLPTLLLPGVSAPIIARATSGNVSGALGAAIFAHRSNSKDG